MATDPYDGNRLQTTHAAVTAIDADYTAPDEATQFEGGLRQSVLVCRANLAVSTARIRLLIYSANLGWVKDLDQYVDLTAGEWSWKFDTYGNTVAIFVEVKGDASALTIEGALTTNEVAGN